MACEGGVGTTNPDIAGLGIIVAFAVQAGISLILSLIVWSLHDQSPVLIGLPNGRNIAIGPTKLEKRRTLERVLATISDIQTVNGIALLVAALVQYQDLDLYHFHIVYDTVNFTAVSFCAALVNLIDSGEEGLTSRLVAIGVFAVLYLAFSILFGIALQEWDDQLPGRCYDTKNISAPGAAHPYVDHIYLAVTCLFLFLILIAALPPFWDIKLPMLRGLKIRNLLNIPMLLEHFRPAERPREFAKRHFQVLKYARVFSDILSLANVSSSAIVGGLRFFFDDTVWDELAEQKKEIVVICPLLFQYPLHLYMVLTMRRWNSGLLDGDSENAWGFGQIVALVLLAPTLLKCVQAIFKYRRIGRFNGDESSVQMIGVTVPLDQTDEDTTPKISRGRAVSI